MPFSGPFTLTSPDAGSGGRWILRADFTWTSSDGPVTVPAGFDTDGTSVPRFLWWWQPPIDGMACRASLPHDFLYRCLAEGRPHQVAPTRRIADKRLYEAALDAGLGRPTAWLMWAGVRVFGRSHIKRPDPA
jgi:hypothetical protein